LEEFTFGTKFSERGEIQASMRLEATLRSESATTIGAHCARGHGKIIELGTEEEVGQKRVDFRFQDVEIGEKTERRGKKGEESAK